MFRLNQAYKSQVLIGRGGEKLTNEIRTRMRMFHRGAHAISADAISELSILI